MGRDETRWCVLRTSGRSTALLAKSLAEVGFDVWTPVETRTKRVPRANIKRSVEIALLPSYLFAASRQIGGLLALSACPTKDYIGRDEQGREVSRRHKDFRVLHKDGRIPLIAEVDLSALRHAENKLRDAQERLSAVQAKFPKGTRVRLSEGGFTGLTGEVLAEGGKFITVAIPGFRMPLKVAKWHLLREETVRKAA